MIYAPGGGGIGGIFKGLTSLITGPAAPETPNIPDSGESAAEERRSQAEAERKERLRAQKRSGRSKTVLTGGGTTGANTAQATVLGGATR
jgi:hypothetical protein